MKNKSKLMIVMCIMIAVMATGYAAFSTVLNITGTASITSEWKVVFSNITEQSKTSGVTIKNTPSVSGTVATFDVGLTSPGDKIVYKITLANQGSLDAIITDIVATATDSPAIIFKVEGVNIGDTLTQKTSKDITVTIEYYPNTTAQPEKLSKTLTVNIVTEQKVNQNITPSTPSINQPMYLSSAILNDNVAQSDINIDFSQVSSDTNGKGLYYTNVNTEDNKTTYYFRGAVENNYIQFGQYNFEVYYGYYDSTSTANYYVYDSLDSCKSAQMFNVNCTKIISYGDPIMWRIVRINEDGSIRLVTQEIVSGIGINNSSNDNSYVGYMYGQPESSTYETTHANTNDSTIKDYLDNWYETNLLSYSINIADSGFCNDRSVATSDNTWATDDTSLGYGQNITYYGAYNRIKTLKQPQFVCPQTNDLFTTSSSSKGNKALINPIGLLTIDEVAYAGGVYSKSDASMYLANGGNFWTMSPSSFSSYAEGVPYGVVARVWYYGSSVGLQELNYSRNEVRPVINLKSTVELSTELPAGCTKLDGTEACPYIIKTN